MAKNNHKCIVCGKEYRFCPNCTEFDKMPRWMSLFCGDNCHDVFAVANDYEGGILTKEKAAEELKKLDLSARDKYHDSLKNSVDKILGEVVKEEKTRTIEPKVEKAKMLNVDKGVNNFNQINKQFKNFNKKK